MLVTIDIPEAVAKVLGENPGAIGRELLEQASAEAYRSGKLTRGQVRGMLGLDWEGTEQFLATHNCDRHYGVKELEEDRANLARILGAA